MLELGVNINSVDKKGNTALFFATGSGTSEIRFFSFIDSKIIYSDLVGRNKMVKYLLKHGANVNATNKLGMNALQIAVFEGRTH